MGIRFLCPNGHKLNIKAYLAGKRGICPECDAKFIIPAESGGQVTAVVDEPEPTVSSQPSPVEPSPALSAETQIEAPPIQAPPAAPSTPQPGNQATPVKEVWYVRPANGDEQYGPASTEVMRSWIAEQRIAPDSWVWKSGWPQWKFGVEAIDELKSPTLENAPAPPANQASTNQTPAAVQLETHNSVNSVAKKLSRTSARGRRQRAQKITVFLGALVLLLGIAVVLVVLL